MKKLALAVAALSFLATGSALAKSKAPARASKADCTKAMENMYKLSGSTPAADAKKDDLAKCTKENTKVQATCMTKAASMDEVTACKDKK